MRAVEILRRDVPCSGNAMRTADQQCTQLSRQRIRKGLLGCLAIQINNAFSYQLCYMVSTLPEKSETDDYLLSHSFHALGKPSILVETIVHEVGHERCRKTSGRTESLDIMHRQQKDYLTKKN